MTIMKVIICFLACVVMTACACNAPYPRSYILSERSIDQGGAVLIAPKLEELNALFLGDTSEEI